MPRTCQCLQQCRQEQRNMREQHAGTISGAEKKCRQEQRSMREQHAGTVSGAEKKNRSNILRSTNTSTSLSSASHLDIFNQQPVKVVVRVRIPVDQHPKVI